MPQHKRSDRPRRRDFTVAAAVDDAVRAQLPQDLLNDRPKHGSYSRLIEDLLRRWLQERGVDPRDFEQRGDQQ